MTMVRDDDDFSMKHGNKNRRTGKHSAPRSVPKHVAADDPSYKLLDEVMGTAKHAALKTNYALVKPATIPIILTCAGLTVAGLNTSYAADANSASTAQASTPHVVSASYTSPASRSYSRAPIETTSASTSSSDGDASWGGIETLSIDYTQSTDQKNAVENLKKVHETASTTLSQTDGKVDDPSTRDALQKEISKSDDLLKDVKTEASVLNDSAKSLSDAINKVNDSVAKKNLKDQQASAARAAASRSASSSSSSTASSSSSNVDWSQIQNPGSKKGNDVVAYAMQFVGKVPYVWAGSTTSGWDCSGFVMYVYGQFGVGLPHYSGAQATVGTAVGSLAEAQPGDIIANGTHAAIYIGNGNVVNALNPSAGTTVTPVKWAFSGGYSIRRIF